MYLFSHFMYRCMYLSMIVYVLLFIIIHLCVLLCAILYVFIGFYRDGISQDDISGAKNNVRLHCSKWPRPLLECQSQRSWAGCQLQQVTVGSVVISSPKNMDKSGLWCNFEAAVELPSKNVHPWFHVIHLSSSIWIRLIWLIMSISTSYLFSIYIATKSRYPDISSHGCRNPRVFLVHASHLLDLRFLHHLSDIASQGPHGEARAGRKRSIRRSNPSPGMASWSLAWKVGKSREKSGKVGKSLEKSGKSLEKSGKVWKTGGLVDWSWRTFNPVQLIPHIHRATDFEYVESTLIQASWLDHPQWGWTHPGKSELPRLHTTFMAQRMPKVVW